ncbi:hypothetical protein KR054_012423 [Drosophila jambulina]|nr:hypothetical protein KR054_012423 [Drosophila jambulina]
MSDSLSSSSSSNSCSSLSSTAAAPGEPLATISYQDEQKSKPTPVSSSVVTSQPVRGHFTSSHHHYHLPHQFQHPHHQNHHTHSVRVPTPTVPSSYAPPPPPASSSEGGSSPNDQRRRAGLLAATSSASQGPDLTAAVSPGRVSARSGSQHHVTIDESSLPRKISSQETPGPSGLIVGSGEGDGDRDIGGGGGGDGGDSSDPPSPGGCELGASQREEGQLALMYHSHQLTNYPVLPAIKRTHRPSFVYPPMPRVKA